MFLPPFFKRLALPLAAGILVLGLACKGSSKKDAPAATTVTVSGKVTFDRLMMLRDANGLPTGFEATATKLNQPARNVLVTLYRQVTVTENSLPQVYFVREATTSTALDGAYSFKVTKGEPYMVELQAAASFRGFVTNDQVTILEDSASEGLYSTAAVNHRKKYCIRKALDGTLPSTAPAANHVATASVSADTTLDFHVGTSDSWFTADTEFDHNANRSLLYVVPGYSPASANYQQAGTLESSPTGSRLLGILDDFASIGYYSGLTSTLTVVPGRDSERFLDLHYKQGVNQPKGTFIEFDQSTYPVTPGASGVNVALNPFTGVTHFMGAVASSDAWDQGAILTLAARSFYYAGLYSRIELSASTIEGHKAPMPIAQALPDLQAELALLEGMPQALAALVQKNPYLGASALDIRDLTSLPAAKRNIYSAPYIRALGWEIALKAHTITGPGTPTQWDTMKPGNLTPFFGLVSPTTSTDLPNLYLQLQNLHVANTSPGGLNPSTIFTDAAIEAMLTGAPLSAPAGNIPWPRPTGGPLSYTIDDWGTQPNGTLPGTTLSMANATLVGSSYPNLSVDELRFGRFLQTGTKTYTFQATTSPATITGGQVEISFISPAPQGTVVRTFLLSGSMGAPVSLTLEGAVGAAASHTVRLRMLSPTTVQPDTTVTLSLVPQN